MLNSLLENIALIQHKLYMAAKLVKYHYVAQMLIQDIADRAQKLGFKL